MLEFTVILLASGFAGYRFGQSDALLGLSAALCTFFAVLNGALIIASFGGVSKTIFNIIIWALSAGVVFTLATQRGALGAGDNIGIPSAAVKPSWLVLFLIAGISAAFPFLYAPIDLSSFDTIHHLGIAKKFMDADSVDFNAFSLSALYTHDIVYFAYAGSTYNLIIGFIADALHIDPLLVLTAFSSLSLAFLLLGAYHLSYNILVTHVPRSVVRSIFIFPILAALTVFIPHLPSEYAGHPGVYWAGYPSVFAMACVLHLLALLVRYSSPQDGTQWALLTAASLATASLHTALTVAAVSFAAGYLVLRILWNWKGGEKDHVKHGLVQFLAVGVPLAIGIGIKIFAVYGLQTPNLLTAQTPSWINVSDDGAIFNYKAIAQKRLPLLVFSAALLLITYACIFRFGTPKSRRPFHAFIILWVLCMAAALLMYLPIATPLLIKILSAPLMFRILWFLEIILPVMCAALISIGIIELYQRGGTVYKAAAGASVIGIIIAGGFSAVAISKSGHEVIKGVNMATSAYNYVHLSSVKQNKPYIDFLTSLPADSRYFVSSWSMGQGTHKRMEMALTSAQLVTPPHTLTEHGQNIAAACALQNTSGRAELRQMLRECRIDYVISYVWPIAETVDQAARDSQSKMQDPLDFIGQYSPTMTYSIERPDNKPVLVKVYNIHDLN